MVVDWTLVVVITVALPFVCFLYRIDALLLF